MMKRFYLYLSACLLAGLFFVGGCRKGEAVSLYTEEVWQSESSSLSVSEPQTGERMVQAEGQTSGEICVYVCGAVQKPGVFQLPSGSRVFEAIEQAGGLREDAAFAAVNQAAVLEDGMQVTVPTQEEVKSGAADGNWNMSENGETKEQRVNINTATAEELKTLPGIGDAKAADIIEYRQSTGGFQTIEEIKNISGIKDAVFEKIKDKIVV